jgi:hypothetical protein
MLLDKDRLIDNVQKHNICINIPEYWTLFNSGGIIVLITFYRKHQLNFAAFGPQANYTDRATAACRWSWCQILWIEGVTLSA